jgi:hypothetical protein
MHVIRISDGVVELQEVTEVKRARLAEFCDALTEQAGYRTPILPAGTVQYATRGKLSVYAVEAPPERRTVHFHPRDGLVQEFSIPFPWTYFFAVFHERALDRVHVFAAPKRVVSADETLFHLPVTNRYHDGLVCLGSYRFDVTLGVPDRVQDVVGYFFDSRFTDEVLDSFNGFVPEEITARTASGGNWFDGWSKLTDAEVAQVRWKPYRKFGEVVELVLSRR